MIQIKVNIKVNTDKPSLIYGSTARERLEHKMERTSKTLTQEVKKRINLPSYNHLESRVSFTNMEAFIYKELMALVEEHIETCPILDPYAIDRKDFNVRAEFILELGNWYADKCICTFILRDTENKHVLTRKLENILWQQEGSFYEITDVAGGHHAYDNPMDVMLTGITTVPMFSCFTAGKRFIRIHYAYLEETKYMRISFAGVKSGTDPFDLDDEDRVEVDDDTDET